MPHGSGIVYPNELIVPKTKRVWSETQENNDEDDSEMFVHKICKIDALTPVSIAPHPDGPAQHDPFTLDLTEINLEDGIVAHRHQMIVVPANVLHAQELAICMNYASYLTDEVLLEWHSDADMARAINFLFKKQDFDVFATLHDGQTGDAYRDETMKKVRQLALAANNNHADAKNDLHANFSTNSAFVVGTIRHFVYVNGPKLDA